MQKLSFLYLVRCSLFDTNSRRLLMWLFCLFSCHENFFVPFSKHYWVSIFYGLELVFNVSYVFSVRNRFRINNVISVWQLATTVAAILVFPIRHSSGFTFVAGWAIQLYIDQWLLGVFPRVACAWFFKGTAVLLTGTSRAQLKVNNGG